MQPFSQSTLPLPEYEPMIEDLDQFGGNNYGFTNANFVCTGCGTPIRDRFYLVTAERFWHLNCLRCTVCSGQLDTEQSCFHKNGYIYCKADYYRLFSSSCARCNKNISLKDLIMRAKNYTFHLACFTCNVCNVPLHPGQYFGLDPASGVLYCQIHYEPLVSNVQSERDEGKMSRTGRPKKRKMHGYHSRSDMEMSQSSRSKRMRTSFKIHQLKTMKEYFNLNHNPDAKDLKQLAQKTGLTKRVLQVWFQNARAKYRRSVQLGEGGQLAESTTSNDPDLNDLATSDRCSTPGSSDLDQNTASNSSIAHSSSMFESQMKSSPSNGDPNDENALAATRSLADYFQNCDIKLL